MRTRSEVSSLKQCSQMIPSPIEELRLSFVLFYLEDTSVIWGTSCCDGCDDVLRRCRRMRWNYILDGFSEDSTS